MSAWANVPSSVAKFATALLGVRLPRVSLEACTPPIEGVHGILTTSQIQYNREKWQLLGREHEYLFWMPGRGPLEVSIQLYLNEAYHYRLFAYCRGGMLLSVNLTLGENSDGSILLSQKLKLATRAMTSEERVDAVRMLATHLTSLGFQVEPDGRVVFGTFAGAAGRFLDTTPKAFLRDFLSAAVLKGHFMANKGYELPGLKRVDPAPLPINPEAARARTPSTSLRFLVLERDQGRCVLCGARADDGVRLHVDHIVPWSRNGRTVAENLQTLCDRCNLGKSNRSTQDFRGRSRSRR
jgi:hypothetical protein